MFKQAFGLIILLFFITSPCFAFVYCWWDPMLGQICQRSPDVINGRHFNNNHWQNGNWQGGNWQGSNWGGQRENWNGYGGMYHWR